MRIKQTKTLENIFGVACYEASRIGHKRVYTDHLFLAILNQTSGHASFILNQRLRDWEIERMREKVESALSISDNYTQDDKKALPEKLMEVDALLSMTVEFGNPKGNIFNTAHLLFTIVADRSSMASRLLNMYGIGRDEVSFYIAQLPVDEDSNGGIMEFGSAISSDVIDKVEPDSQHFDTENPPSQAITKQEKRVHKDPILKYGIDLTKVAACGELDPVVGREVEIERLIQILGRRKKNNPILIGEPGVGKSAIVEGLATRIIEKKVPYTLQNKRIFMLDITSLVAGTKYRGEFEERINELIGYLRKNRDVILFIDEIHTIVGAGSTQGSLDTANVLKPALARGDLQCIGATTLNEYRENIEKDGALERRFQKIIVGQPSAKQTLEMLHNLKKQYEEHHCVKYSDAALEACVKLTERYVTERFFPDKAIDVLDEAGSRASLGKLNAPKNITAIESELESIARDKKDAVESQEFETAAQLYQLERAGKDKLSKARNKWLKSIKSTPTEVDQSDINEVVSIMTGIPSSNLSADDKSHLRGLSKEFEETVIGQNNAVQKVTRAVLRSRAGLKDPNRPIGVFMFTGPTGVGKTHLAKELSRRIFGNDDALLRVDMSEYSERHNVSRLIGSPPGYVGYGEGGQLTEKVRRKPYSVVLFDEIEKAHTDIFNLMLQIFDEGQLTDGVGRKVDFRNTIIIMTSNIGSAEVAQKSRTPGYDTGRAKKSDNTRSEVVIRKCIDGHFKPEFINRIDEIVMFNSLSKDDIGKIVSLELKGVSTRIDEMGYSLELTDKANNALAELGYDSNYGARSLKRTIIERIESPIAELIIEGKLFQGCTVVADVQKNGNISIKVRPKSKTKETKTA